MIPRFFYSADADDSSEPVYDGVIDAHVHFWKYNKKRDTWITSNMKTLREDYLPPTFAGTMKRNGVDGCIAVQADSSELETHFLVELSKSFPIIRGVVGWIDFQKDDIEERLDYFSQYTAIKGWRHIVQSEPDDFLLRPEFQKGIEKLAGRDYSYDLLIYPRQLDAALQFVNRFPGLKIVIDHCAKPNIAGKEMEPWASKMRELAKNPNVYCKLSGLFTEAKWKEWRPVEFYPYFDTVFEAFGTDRLMYGSDWPVMLLSGIYVQWKSMLEKYMEDFDIKDKRKIFGQNAAGFYNLV